MTMKQDLFLKIQNQWLYGEKMEIDILKLSLTINTYLSKRDAEKIRGYLGNLYRENSYIHQHDLEGNPIYRYPRLQYKVIDGACVIIAFKEGLKMAEDSFHNLKLLNLNGKWEEVLTKGLESYIANFSISSDPIKYSFLTPWLALNQKNYEKYQKLGSMAKRKELLENILIGNIISISKSLGYTVPVPIEANIHHVKEVKTSLKETPMVGFLGDFSVNFEIPDYWGIGKSVSKGFGTVKRVG